VFPFLIRPSLVGQTEPSRRIDLTVAPFLAQQCDQGFTGHTPYCDSPVAMVKMRPD